VPVAPVTRMVMFVSPVDREDTGNLVGSLANR
jgi:hypothetical protein